MVKEDVTTLIINGHEITSSSEETFNCEFSFGEIVIDYPLNIKVIKDSKCDKFLREALENQDKYFVQINIKPKGEK